MGSLETTKPVIIDTGHSTIKAGFAGEDRPRKTFPTIVGRSRYSNSLGQDTQYFGDDARSKRGILEISHPIRDGLVTNWDDMQEIWCHTLYRQLRVVPEEHNVLLTDSALEPTRDRQKSAELMFEAFNTAGLLVVNKAFLSLVASGEDKLSGMVVQAGDGLSYALAFNNGALLRHTATPLPIAGRSLTEQMQTSLNYDSMFDGSGGRDICREIKEKLCYVAQNFSHELVTSDRCGYELPDGSPILVGNERFYGPESLFQPCLAGSRHPGIHQASHDAIMACDAAIRPHLYSNVVLAGGTTLLPGFESRFTKELTALAPAGAQIKVHAARDRPNSSFLGASLLTNCSSFQPLWITKQDYDEAGPSICDRRMFM